MLFCQLRKRLKCKSLTILASIQWREILVHDIGSKIYDGQQHMDAHGHTESATFDEVGSQIRCDAKENEHAEYVRRCVPDILSNGTGEEETPNRDDCAEIGFEIIIHVLPEDPYPQ
jgi:hypothetical protein